MMPVGNKSFFVLRVIADPLIINPFSCNCRPRLFNLVLRQHIVVTLNETSLHNP